MMMRIVPMGHLHVRYEATPAPDHGGRTAGSQGRGLLGRLIDGLPSGGDVPSLPLLWCDRRSGAARPPQARARLERG